MRIPFFSKRPSLAAVLTGRELNALYLDNDTTAARLRFSDGSAVAIDLRSRRSSPIKAKEYPVWIALPGWVRITNVLEDASQIILVVSGAIYTARISLRVSRDRWQIHFSNGRLL
ncbi:MAG: hypothetical protein ACOYYI_09435 [Chloroflexota bacterium]